MENMEKKCGDKCCEGGKSSCQSGCGGCYGEKYFLVKVILKLLIVAIIFFFGFKLGLLTGFLESGYGRGGADIKSYGFGMMRGYNNILPNQPAQ